MENNEVLRLLERIAQGDNAAFNVLYKAFSRTVSSYAMHNLNDASRAQEIVNDTFLEIWMQPKRFRGHSKFSTWLIGIAHNKVLMEWRRGKRGADLVDIDLIGEDIPSGGESAFIKITKRQRREATHRCLVQLSFEQRECVYLAYYEDLSAEEVATVQGSPVGTAKSRLFHARQKLKGCMSRLLNSEGNSGIGDEP